MEEKLQKLFKECKEELYSIGIDLNDNAIGNISINIGKRNCKRYGCCKQENPDEKSKYVETIGRKRGCLVKGGEVDYDKVCNVVINDIKDGTIKGITFDRYE